MESEFEKGIDDIIERAKALKVPPLPVSGQAQGPHTIHEFRLRQLDFMTEQIQYIRGLLIVKHRSEGMVK